MRYLIAFALVLLVSVPIHADAARLWSSGCELQGDSPATPTDNLEFDTDQSGAATQAISTSVVRSGVSSCTATGNGSGWALFQQQFSAAPSTEAFYARYYLYIHTTPTSNTQVGTWYNSTDMESSLVVTSTRTLELYDDGGLLVGTYATPLSTGTWYRIEQLYNSAVDNLDVRLDGTTIIDASCTGCDGADWFAVGVDDTIASPTGVFYFDDIALNNTSGGSQTSWPGAGSIVHMQPDGSAGDNNDASAGTCADIDEITPDSGTTVALLNSDLDIIDCTAESSSTAGIDAFDTVTLVQVGINEKVDDIVSASWALRVKSASGGTTSTGTTVTHNDETYKTNGDTAPRNYSLTSYTDPTTGIAWTPTGTNSLDAMQIGAQSIDASPDVRVTTLWGLIEYVDGAAPVAAEKMRSRVAGGRLKVQSGRFILRSN